MKAMTRDQHATKKGKRTPVRKRTRSLAFSSAREQHTRRNGPRAGAAGHHGSAKQYLYAGSGVLPTLRRQALNLNPSRAVALLLLVAMIAMLVWFFVDTSFYVYAADVTGNSLITADEVYRAGGLDCMSIFYINRRQVAQNIQRLIPGVTQVQVQCHLPGRVSVRLREEDVRFLWRNASAAFLVDGDGRVLKVDDGTHSDLLVIHDQDSQPQPLLPGDRVDRTALETVSGLHGLLPEVQVFGYSRDKGISVSDARGWRVYFGDDEELAAKVATLQALLLKLERERKTVKMIDLRFVGSPYYQ